MKCLKSSGRRNTAVISASILILKNYESCFGIREHFSEDTMRMNTVHEQGGWMYSEWLLLSGDTQELVGQAHRYHDATAR